MRYFALKFIRTDSAGFVIGSGQVTLSARSKAAAKRKLKTSVAVPRKGTKLRIVVTGDAGSCRQRKAKPAFRVRRLLALT